MSAPDYGGPAFPHQERNDDGSHHYSHPGESLRDWFAGQALVGMGIWEPLRDDLHNTCANKARWAYAQADAMLAERAKFYDAEAKS